jgi:serine/threonine-protein kinase
VSLTPGTRVGAYEIVSLLGVGGMGEVYRARDTQLSRNVAVKILPDVFASDPERLARFGREAQVLAALNQPNIAQIYAVETNGSTRALVMELVEGPTLAERIAKRPIPLEEALPIARQIAEALEAAHEQGIVHRDLKPANIKVRADGTVKVLDFGLAKLAETTAPTSNASLANSPTITSPAMMTGVGVLLGTAAYMSPEQAKGRPADKRSDIWAFGCVLYEMLTSRRAFDGEDVTDTIVAVMSKEPDWSVLPAAMSPGVVRLMRRSVEKDPKRRLRDIGEARIQIEDAAGGKASESDPKTMSAHSKRSTLLEKTGWVVAGAIAASALIGLVALQFRPAQGPAPVTRFSIPVPEGQPFTNAGRLLVAFSPDGSSLVYNANSRLHLRAMSGLGEQVISGSEESSGLLSPAFSPDGKSLAFYSQADRSIKRLEIRGGTAVRICMADPVFGLSWDEHGIVFAQRGKGILRVSPNGGTPEIVASVAEDEIAGNPQLLPDGRTVLFSVAKSASAWDKGQIVAQRLGDRSRKVLIEPGSDGRYLPTGHLLYALSGIVLAVPFDPVNLVTSGGSVPVIEGVRRASASSASGGPGVAQFSFSTTGSLAYIPGPVVSQGTLTNLARFDRKGGVEPLKLPLGPYVAPRVSPNGNEIAFERDDEREASIWRYTLAGGRAAQRLTFGGNNRAPVWSADGEWIVYQSDREGDRAIFRQRADGTGTAERLTTPEAGVTHTPQSSSSDGAHLLFSVQKGTESRLWTMSLKDRKMTAYGDMNAREAAFSPNGRWIVYQTPVDGSTNAVFLEPFPRTGSRHQVPLADTVTGGQPFWSPTGDEIIMNTGPFSSTAILVTTKPSVSFGRPEPFSRVGRNDPPPTTDRRNTDMLPDGQHVIGVVAQGSLLVGGQTPQIVVVQNWFTELQQRVPTR